MDDRWLREALQVYGILDSSLGDEGELIALAEMAMGSGVTALQLRCKGWDGGRTYRLARELARRCASEGVLFIVNDRLDVALASGARGVHLGASDLPVEAARRVAGEDFVIGGTARTLERGLELQAAGASYLGCGAAFQSGTKEDTVVIGPHGIGVIARGVSIPCVAIGGIGEHNLERLRGSNVAGIAMCGALFRRDPGRMGDLCGAVRRTIEDGGGPVGG